MRYKIFRIDVHCFYLIICHNDKQSVIRIGNSEQLNRQIDTITTHVLICKQLPPDLLQELMFYRNTLHQGIKYISLPQFFQAFVEQIIEQEGTHVHLNRSIIRVDIGKQSLTKLDKVLIYFYRNKNVQFRSGNNIFFDVKKKLAEEFNPEAARRDIEFLQFMSAFKDTEIFYNLLFEEEALHRFIHEEEEFFAAKGITTSKNEFLLLNNQNEPFLSLEEGSSIIFSDDFANTFFLRHSEHIPLLKEYVLALKMESQADARMPVRMFGYLKTSKHKAEKEYRFHPIFPDKASHDQLRLFSRLKNLIFLKKDTTQRFFTSVS